MSGVLGGVFVNAVTRGTDAAVWYRNTIQFRRDGKDALTPLYFVNNKKQLLCLRNCLVRPYAHAIGNVLTHIKPVDAYVYHGVDGDTFVLHVSHGIVEAREHRPLYDYSGDAVSAPARLHADKAVSVFLRTLENVSSRKMYTSIVFRSSEAWHATEGWGPVLALIADAAIATPLQNHVIVTSYLRQGGTLSTSFARLDVPRAVADGTALDGQGWHGVHVHDAHQRFLHPALRAKTVSASGDCLYSALAYAVGSLCLHNRGLLTPVLRRLQNDLQSSGAPAQFMRAYINGATTLQLLQHRFCEGSATAFARWMSDGSLLHSGIVDEQGDAGFIRGQKPGAPGDASTYDAIMAYKNSNAYWGRDFDVQVFEMLTGVGVVIFGSPAFFGEYVDILARKPNGPCRFYVTLYNADNSHFEVVGQGEGRVCGWHHTTLPPWLAYILNATLCVDVVTGV